MPSTEYVAFDLETTGLIAEVDRIVEIGAIRFHPTGRELGRFLTLVNPSRPMPPAVQAIHGIGDADVAGAPKIADVLPEFLKFLGDPKSTLLLAHNASFDAGFLGRELGRTGLQAPNFGVIDTLALSRSIHPELPTHRLQYLTKIHQLTSDDPHRALGDCTRVKELWLRLGGPSIPVERLVTFPIFDPVKEKPTPRGWERLEIAISNGHSIRMEYEGGSQGLAPRTITPRRVEQRGGIVYVVATCHLAQFEKSFRLDRIRCYEIIEAGPSYKTLETR